VSLIVAAYNEESVIEAKIRNSLELDYPLEKLEIIIASGGSTDRTVEIARSFEFQNVRVLELPPKRGKASALNDAVPVSTGEVLCLSDANVMLRPDALTRQIEHLANPEIGAVTGDVRLLSEDSDFGAGETLYYKVERAVQLGESASGSVMGVDGGMYVIRRELFQQLRPDTILDDFVTSMNVVRQKKRIAYEPDAIAIESGTPTWQDEFRRRVRVMVGAVQSIRRGQWPLWSRPVELWQYASHKLLRWGQPICLAALLVSSIFLWRQGPFYQAMLALQLGFYAIAVLAAMSLPLRSTRLGGVPFYFTMSHVAMLIGIVKGALTRPSGVWKRTPRPAMEAVPAVLPVADEASRTLSRAREAVVD
jgi:cellulose synthase/poly-beta-1,6-N-acetylglucosamine synthase-like glycosyltransferase